MEKSHQLTWVAREEKGKRAPDFEYVLGGIAFLFIVLAVLNKNFTIVPIIVIGTLSIIVSMKKNACCISYSLSQKGFKINESEYRWEQIKQYNIIDDPGIKGRLILKTESFVGTIVCPIYDDDINTIDTIFRKYNIKKDEYLLPTFIDKMSRMF